MLLQKIVQEPRPMLSSPEHIYVRRLQTCYVNNLKFRELHSSFGLWGFSKRCYMQKKMVTRSSNNSSLGRGLYYLSIGKNWVPVKGVPFLSREALYVDTHTHTHTHKFPLETRPNPGFVIGQKCLLFVEMWRQRRLHLFTVRYRQTECRIYKLEWQKERSLNHWLIWWASKD